MPGFDFLDKWLDGKNGIQASYEADLAGAAGQFAGVLLAPGVAKAQSRTRAMVAAVNTRRAARESRYQLGMTKVVEAAQGGGYGDAVFRAAENARAAEERVLDVELQAKFADIDANAQVPSVLDGLSGFIGDVVTARATRNAKIARYDGKY